jgi:hypothetical protein
MNYTQSRSYKIQVLKGDDDNNIQSEVNGLNHRFSRSGGGMINSGGVQSDLTKTLLFSVGSKAIQYGISNYGNLMGDYVGQTNAQAAIELVGMIAIAASSPIGFATAIAGLGIKEVSRQLDVYQKNLNAQMLRERIGLNVISGGRM